MTQDRKLQAQRLSDNAPIVTHGRLSVSPLFGYHVHRRRAGHRAWDWDRSSCCLSRGRLEPGCFLRGLWDRCWRCHRVLGWRGHWCWRRGLNLWEVTEQDVSQQGWELLSASPGLGQAMSLPLLRFAWPVPFPQVRRRFRCRPSGDRRCLRLRRHWSRQGLDCCFRFFGRCQFLRWAPVSAVQSRRIPAALEVAVDQEGTSSNTLHLPGNDRNG